MEPVLGVVAAITVFPVRSASARDLHDVEVTPRGLAGDREWVVTRPDGTPVRGKDAPQLGGVTTTGDPDADAAAVRAVLGPDHTLTATERTADVAPVHLVSRGALERAAHGRVPEGCSADDPRANLVLETDEDERQWVGRTLAVGNAVLRITRTPKHCLGVYAEVHTPGRIEVGDPVRPAT